MLDTQNDPMARVKRAREGEGAASSSDSADVVQTHTAKKQKITDEAHPVATTRKPLQKERRSCPYLGTINRHLLDFDFEKLCSVCLTNQHVYCCLVCGRYFQGRGKNTYAHTHSLEEDHYVFINLKDCRVYCLPDNYEVVDASLHDIKYFLNPTYKKEEVRRLSSSLVYGKALDGTDFIPGCIGLNNLKKTHYFNVIIQLICHVIPLRNALLLSDLSRHQRPDPVLATLGELIRKMFNPRNFKGIVSPHEFLQAVGQATEKKFRIGTQQDPLELLGWLLNRLHQKMRRKVKEGAADREKNDQLEDESSVIYSTFRGRLHVTTGEGEETTEAVKPFLYLALDLPPAPIFKDSLDRNIMPQIPIFDVLQKFDGATPQETADGETRRYSLWSLPKYLVLHIKRFWKNNFFVEKNPTIVTFPVKNLDLRDYVHPDAVDANPVARYNLVGNVCHVGQPHDGVYKVHVLHAPTSEWYEIEDLRVTQVLPQLVALSESYVQIYQRQDVLPDESLDEAMRAGGLSQ